MRTLRIVGIGAAAFGLPIVGLIAYGSWVNAHMRYPGPENASAFLLAYDPKAVVKPFANPQESYSHGDGSGGGAGTKFVAHFAHFDEYFTMRADQRDSLMVAVNQDASRQLLLNGARILNQSGAPSNGFRLQYATGNIIGEVSIQPVAPGLVHRSMPLSPGLEDLSLKIRVREQWFPKGIPQGRAQLLPDSDR